MNEIISQFQAEIPKFFQNFIKMLTTPKVFLEQQQKDSTKDTGLKKGLIFYCICNVLGMVFLFPVYGDAEFHNPSKFFIDIIMSIAIVVLIALSVNISWRIVGKKRPYMEYLTFTCYQVGVITMVWLFVGLINLSILKLHYPQIFPQVVNATYNYQSSDLLNNWFAEPSLQLYGAVGTFYILWGIYWYLKQWSVYQTLNQASKFKTIVSMIVFITLSGIAFWPIIAAVGQMFK